ncbi:T-lymphocyte surface antigen Ly-9-like [Rhinoraja longicauda]
MGPEVGAERRKTNKGDPYGHLDTQQPVSNSDDVSYTPERDPAQNDPEPASSSSPGAVMGTDPDWDNVHEFIVRPSSLHTVSIVPLSNLCPTENNPSLSDFSSQRQFQSQRRPALLLTASLVSSAGTGAAAGTVTGALGHSVSLPAGITVAQSDGDSVVWRRTSPKTSIVKYSNGNIKYYDTNYTGRVTLHRGNFSLEIRDLRREDAGDYLVDVVPRTGSETLAKVRLGVYEPVSGTEIRPQNITGICNFTLTCSVTSGDPTSFRWWRGGEALRNDITHHLRGHGETVEVHHTAEVGDVVYKCEARNPVSKGTAQIRLMDVCKQTTPGLRSCLCGCWLRATVAAVLLLILLSVTVATHIISSRPVTGTADRPHKTE